MLDKSQVQENLFNLINFLQLDFLFSLICLGREQDGDDLNSLLNILPLPLMSGEMLYA
jgi:hypothetical protein